ncbi:MAG TPA: hypothetical protein VFO65_01095 [Acidimicrobiales bacterium]|nr:hypothetical protein [Acidimicrobiales bacterium]
MNCPWNPLDCPGNVVRTVAGDAFDSIALQFGQLADAAITWLWRQVAAASAVELGGPGFTGQLRVVLIITGVVAVGLFALQLSASALRRDMGGLGRGLKGLVVAFIGGGAAIGVTNALLAATDSLSDGIVMAATGGTMEEMGRALVATGAIQSATANASGVLLLSLFALVATVAVWAALMVRKVLIVVSAVFAPVAFAGSISDVTVSWTRRWIETTLALIVSKLLLVIIFVVGLEVLLGGAGQAGDGVGQSVTQVVSGLLVLLVAGTAPLVALKLVHWSGSQFHNLHALATTSTGGVHRTVDWSRSAARKASIAAGAGFGGAAGAGAAGGGFKMIGSDWPRSGGGGSGGRATGVQAHPPLPDDPPAGPARRQPPAPPRPATPPPAPDRAAQPEPPLIRDSGRAADTPDRRRP